MPAQQIETAPTEAETDALLAEFSAWNERDGEYRAELAQARNSFEAYWAGSAAAQFQRDMRAGRFVTVDMRGR